MANNINEPVEVFKVTEHIDKLCKKSINNCFLIDYENVRSEGLYGIEKLSKNSAVVIMYSKNADKLSMDLLNFVGTNRIITVKVGVGQRNALDFQLVSFLGYIIARHKYLNMKVNYFVVTGDSGFDSACRFWRAEGYSIHRTLSIANGVKTISDMKDTIQTNKESLTSVQPVIKPSDNVQTENEKLVHNEPKVDNNISKTKSKKSKTAKDKAKKKKKKSKTTDKKAKKEKSGTKFKKDKAESDNQKAKTSKTNDELNEAMNEESTKVLQDIKIKGEKSLQTDINTITNANTADADQGHPVDLFCVNSVEQIGSNKTFAQPIVSNDKAAVVSLSLPDIEEPFNIQLPEMFLNIDEVQLQTLIRTEWRKAIRGDLKPEVIKLITDIFNDTYFDSFVKIIKKNVLDILQESARCKEIFALMPKRLLERYGDKSVDIQAIMLGVDNKSDFYTKLLKLYNVNSNDSYFKVVRDYYLKLKGLLPY